MENENVSNKLLMVDTCETEAWI